MNIEITQEKETPILARKEISGKVTFTQAPPSNEDVSAALATSCNVTPGLIAMKSIYTHYGMHTANFTAFVYTDAEVMKVLERKGKKAREKEEKAKKAQEEAAAKAAEVKEEVPAETKEAEQEEPAVEEKTTEEKSE